MDQPIRTFLDPYAPEIRLSGQGCTIILSREIARGVRDALTAHLLLLDSEDQREPADSPPARGGRSAPSAPPATSAHGEGSEVALSAVAAAVAALRTLGAEGPATAADLLAAVPGGRYTEDQVLAIFACFGGQHG